MQLLMGSLRPDGEEGLDQEGRGWCAGEEQPWAGLAGAGGYCWGCSKHVKEEVSVLWSTQSLPLVPQEAGVGPGIWAVGTVTVSSVLAMGGCHLALVVTTQGDTCIPGCKGRLLTNSS